MTQAWGSCEAHDVSKIRAEHRRMSEGTFPRAFLRSRRSDGECTISNVYLRDREEKGKVIHGAWVIIMMSQSGQTDMH